MLNQGLHKRWGTKFLLRELAKCVFYPQGREAEFEATNRRAEARIRDYADGLVPWVWTDPNHHGLRLLRTAAYEAIESGSLDADALALGLLYRLREQQMWHARELSWLRIGQTSGHTEDLARTSEAIAAAFSLGWTNQAVALADAALLLLPRSAYWSADPKLAPAYQPYRMCFGRFVLQIYSDFADRAMPHLMPRHPYESPVYDRLLACWRHPDPAALVEPMKAACDWHTHECMYSRSMDPGKRVDFSYDAYMGWPIEVHTVYRLREALGLRNPGPLDHPLMQTPLAAYLSPCPVPDDGVVGRMTLRAIEQFPVMAEMV